MPAVTLPEITLPSPAAAPPIVFPVALVWMTTPKIPLPTAAPEIHSAASVEPDQVALNDGAVRAGLDGDALAVVPGDDVALAGSGPTDRVDASIAVNRDPERVEDHRRAGRVQTDVVALDLGAYCTRADLDAGPVAGDHVPRKTRAAHDRPLGADDVDTNAAIGNPGRAARTSADEVPLDDVVVGGRTEHGDGMRGVTRHDIAGSSNRAANGVAAGTVRELDAADGRRVRERPRTAGVDADVVALNDVPGRAGAADEDGRGLVAGNDVARRRRQAANPVARRVDPNAEVAVRSGKRARRIGPDEVAFNDVAALREQAECATAKPVDRQAANDRVAARDHEAAERLRVAIQLDQRRRA